MGTFFATLITSKATALNLHHLASTMQSLLSSVRHGQAATDSKPYQHPDILSQTCTGTFLHAVHAIMALAPPCDITPKHGNSVIVKKPCGLECKCRGSREPGSKALIATHTLQTGTVLCVCGVRRFSCSVCKAVPDLSGGACIAVPVKRLHSNSIRQEPRVDVSHHVTNNALSSSGNGLSL